MVLSFYWNGSNFGFRIFFHAAEWILLHIHWFLFIYFFSYGNLQPWNAQMLSFEWYKNKLKSHQKIRSIFVFMKSFNLIFTFIFDWNCIFITWLHVTTFIFPRCKIPQKRKISIEFLYYFSNKLSQISFWP